ncbi:MAG TPA: hypothetical protein VGN37_16170 [Actinocatenispora sp.]
MSSAGSGTAGAGGVDPVGGESHLLRDFVQWVITCFALLSIVFGFGSVRDVYRYFNRNDDVQRTASARLVFVGSFVGACTERREKVLGPANTRDAVTWMSSEYDARLGIHGDWDEITVPDGVGSTWLADVDGLADDFSTQTGYLRAATVSYEARDWSVYQLSVALYEGVETKLLRRSKQLGLGSAYSACFVWPELPRLR